MVPTHVPSQRATKSSSAGASPRANVTVSPSAFVRGPARKAARRHHGRRGWRGWKTRTVLPVPTVVQRSAASARPAAPRRCSSNGFASAIWQRTCCPDGCAPAKAAVKTVSTSVFAVLHGGRRGVGPACIARFAGGSLTLPFGPSGPPAHLPSPCASTGCDLSPAGALT